LAVAKETERHHRRAQLVSCFLPPAASAWRLLSFVCLPGLKLAPGSLNARDRWLGFTQFSFSTKTVAGL
jgi:hypothetical protein